MQIHSTCIIDEDVVIGEGTKIWHFCHVMSGARIGKNCNIGQGCFIGSNVVIGDNCKIQNNVSIFEGVTIEDNVFIGPSVVFTNVLTPRAFVKKPYSITIIKQGVSIGANSTIVCGVIIDEYAFIGAGAVVTKDIERYSLVIGNPGRVVGSMNEDGSQWYFEQKKEEE
jgi:UDP-2-acetamido-3-amino-2,3-dideoxy-glucuronate N-acetyltransferase